MNFLVTGSTGILAQQVIKSLLAEGHIVNAFSRTHDARSSRQGEAKYRNDELLNFNNQVDAVIHCAFTRSEDPAELSTSLQFTYEVAKFCNAQKIPTVINISSQSVYSDQSHGHLLDETSAVTPATRYGLAKFSSELILSNLNCTNAITIRLGSLIGKGMEVRALHKMTLNAWNNNQVTALDGRQFCSLISVDDAARAVISIALATPPTEDITLNLTSHEQPTLEDIVQQIALTVEKAKDAKVDIVYIPAVDQMPASLKISTSKLERDYGIVIRDSIANTIKQILSDNAD
ncbi:MULTISPECIES: NAD(P)-dependent oxidoreductase [unclassified Halomonas]|uniref:NAD-dependent epimerase/dehydratase family protein n=1 Tax=unclassified Halomonas TaxID=2609666 RepID=UPI0007D8DE0F|nr:MULTISPECIES: NAD(P)-dependent oxidoreductase [unclassified Halomonas]MBT2786000.1 NAD(P)-dependent oxidoreductase [Halomonas sp. ISL-106]MBT2797022.1 NAD(P)-dependent oxidoreductase [Halomonas sp. ISL-104]OAL58409.1 hypothetical protein A6R74_05815 [Halomonas sp. ALS9]